MKVVISLGGSLIYPDDIDTKFLKSFKEVIESYVKKGHSFIIICGGGKLARVFQEKASMISTLSDEEKDWLGISATKINAQLVKSIFDANLTHKIALSNPTIDLPLHNQIIICSGWKPGWSTDYDAVILAIRSNADKIINLSNIDQVYDIDPKNNPEAKPFDKISWKDFRKIVGDKWEPGLNMPFDPIAAKKADEAKLQVIIAGKSLKNLKNILDKKEFVGTTIIVE